jgi:peptidyl-prolyl cis-trans isomerase SurA
MIQSARVFLLGLICILSANIAPVFATSTAKKLPVLDKMVAAVNGEAITESQLNRQTQILLTRLQQTTTLPPMSVLQKQLLERMILEKLQLQLASQDTIDIDETTLNHALQDIAIRDGLSLSQLQQFLEEQGVSFAQFKETVKTELMLSKVQQKELGQQITISKAEIDHFLNSPAGLDQSGAEYNLGHILITFPSDSPSKAQQQKTQQHAEQIVGELKAGANFAKMAMAKSASQHALNGGDLGWRKIESIPTTFVKIAPALQIGEIYGPIRDNSGFHIIKLLNKRAQTTPAGKSSAEAHVRQILIKTNEKKSDTEAQTLLTALRTRIINGTSFTTLAQQYSEEATATKGGDIGWVTEKGVVPEFYQAITKLKSGEISQPFKSPLGWHLVLMLEKRSAHVPSETMRNKAMEILYQRKFDELLVTWLRQLRNNAEVQTYLNEN